MRLISFTARRRDLPRQVYQITDRLHAGRIARVSDDAIASTVSVWLAEFEVVSPLVDDLARAVRNGDWASTYTIANALSVDVAVAV